MRRYGAFILLLAAACPLACVEREFVITSEPEGAVVRISDKEIGRTPVRQPFTWYGDYEIALRMDGHKTLKTHRNIILPWYEVPPLDLLSALAPWTYRDERHMHFTLEKLTPPDEEQLLKRAEDLRQRNQQGTR